MPGTAWCRFILSLQSNAGHPVVALRSAKHAFITINFAFEHRCRMLRGATGDCAPVWHAHSRECSYFIVERKDGHAPKFDSYRPRGAPDVAREAIFVDG